MSPEYLVIKSKSNPLVSLEINGENSALLLWLLRISTEKIGFADQQQNVYKSCFKHAHYTLLYTLFEYGNFIFTYVDMR